MTEPLGGAPPLDPNPGAGASGSSGKGSTVVYQGLEGRRFGAFEIEVDDETWAFPLDREVKGVPDKVVDALREIEDHTFDIKKEG